MSKLEKLRVRCDYLQRIHSENEAQMINTMQITQEMLSEWVRDFSGVIKLAEGQERVIERKDKQLYIAQNKTK